MQTASSTYRSDGQSANKPTMADSRRFTQKLSKTVSREECANLGSSNWQQCPTSRKRRLGQCCSSCVTAASVSFCDVVSSKVRSAGEQIIALSMDDCTKFAAVNEGQLWNICVAAWSVSCGQCMSQAISSPGWAMMGDTRPLSSVRSRKRRAGLLLGCNSSVVHWSVSCRQCVTDSNSSRGSATVMLEMWHLEMYKDLNSWQEAMSFPNCSSGMEQTPVRLRLVKQLEMTPGSLSNRLSMIWRPCSRGLEARKERTISSEQLLRRSMRKRLSGRDSQPLGCAAGSSGS
mmetsp:Transcript_21003/g.57387  ORF Transcript_21003/g.57387 Transcript_21003/m.57387 type:complete len:288 (-) Transcript_21003:349-1212(-)